MWADNLYECLDHQNIGSYDYNYVFYVIFWFLVNAADNKQRDKKMNAIKITIDP